MDNRLILYAIVILGLLPSPVQRYARACTTFQLNHEGQIYVGKNYDWMVEDGLIFANKRGVTKTAMESTVDNTGLGRPVKWTSKYGSITFAQYGRELGPGGMNEAGLVVESMGLFQNTPNRKYPNPDERVSILVQQWRQYQLDNFTSVKEVIESDAYLRIRPRKGVHAHFIISDKDGNCATIEFLDGKMVCHTNNTLPHRVLTNNTYAVSLDFLEKDITPEPDRFKSIERFIRASRMVQNYNPKASASPIEYAFDILKSVSWTANRNWKGTPYLVNTRWSIVYDQSNLCIYFKTHGNQKPRVVFLKSFDFSCKKPVKIFDITSSLSGDVSNNFADYTQQSNRKLIENAFTKTLFFPKLSTEQLDTLSKYPDTFICGN
jgi:choloylglycine hydrolase